MESIHDYVVHELQSHKGAWPTVARKSGVPYKTLKKIATRESVSPRICNLERLAAYLRNPGQAI